MTRIIDLPLEEGTVVISPDSKVLKSGILSEDFVVQGTIFKKGTILGFDENGRLWRCKISGTTLINELHCMAGSEVEFYPEGNLLSFIPAVETNFRGIFAAAGSLVMFHPNGSLFKCDISRDAVIDGYPVLAGRDVCFFEDGGLAAFYLSRECLIDGILCPEGSRVWLRKNRLLAACTAGQDVEIQEVHYKAGELIVLREDGTPVHSGS